MNLVSLWNVRQDVIQPPIGNKQRPQKDILRKKCKWVNLKKAILPKRTAMTPQLITK